MNTLYYPSYAHAAPYFVGAWAGRYLSQINRQWNVSKKFVTLGWIASNSTVLFTLWVIRFGLESGLFISAFYPGLGRLLWSVGVAFMFLATTTQFGNGRTKLDNT
jgi:hypothetical protein